MKFLTILIFLMSLTCTVHSESLTSNEIVTATKVSDPNKEIAVWNQLIGSWFGSQNTTDGKTRKWLIKQSSDGKYQIHFKIYKSSSLISEKKEYGEWGFSGNIMFTIVKGWVEAGKVQSAEPVNPYCYNAYIIEKLTESTMEYKHVETGNFYSIKKVPDTYIF